jgi:signal transduction histidine kinase
MHSPGWWHLAVLGTSTALIVLALVAEGLSVSGVGSIVAVAAFAVGWVLIGRHAWRSETAGIVYSVIVILSAGVAVGFVQWLAIIQTVAFPVLWAVSRSFRGAIVANVGLAASVGIGQWFAAGRTTEGAIQALAIELVSLGFSISIGYWITSIEVRSAARQTLLDELHETQQKLTALSRESGITSERERLAREIHDTIAQDLTGLVLLAQQSQRLLASGDTEGAGRQLSLLEENARLALSETRSLVAATSPAALDDGGLHPALDRLAARFTRETGVLVTVSADVATPLNRASEVALLRCAQEGLANIRKHSGAGVARLALITSESGTTLTVEDDGSGFDPTTVGDGFGLSGMRERLALVGGDLELETSPAGTRLVITLPAESAS